MAISLLDKEFSEFISINNSELVSKWNKLIDSEKSDYGCERNGYACFLRDEFKSFQNGKTEYK